MEHSLTDPGYGPGEVEWALAAARELAAVGVPIFVAPPDPRAPIGFALPAGWQRTAPDPAAIDAWRPGDALCAVTGHALDVIDVDPRNGGDLSPLIEAGLLPYAYAVAATPSGGVHRFVAGLGVRKLGNVTPGVDLQAGVDGEGHGFVFLAPTVRASKVDGAARAYRWVVSPYADAIREGLTGDDTGVALAEVVRVRHGDGPRTLPQSPQSPQSQVAGQLDRAHDTPDTPDTLFADDGLGDAVIPHETARRICNDAFNAFYSMDPSTGHGFNVALNAAAFTLGRYVGSMTDYEQAASLLYDAAAHNGCVTRKGPVDYRPMGAAAVRATIASGLRAGMRHRNTVGPREPSGGRGDDPEGSGEEISDRSVPGVPDGSEPGGRPSRRVDLWPFLNGSYVAPAASVGGELAGSRRLLYPGRWHTAVGPTGSGKSWWATWHAVEELRRGNAVAYAHFEESSPAMTLERLRGMAPELTPDDIVERFVWLDCTTSWSTPKEFAEALPDAVSLVVLDGINAAATQHALDPSSPEAVGAYRRKFVAPATARGAAVLSLGHPPKARDRQDERHGFGSTAWLDEVDGIGFRIMAASGKAIRRGREGACDVWAVKDRGGSVEQHGQRDEGGRRDGWTYLGRFHLDSSAERANIVGWMSAPSLASVEGFTVDPVERLGDEVLKVVDALNSAGVKATRTAVCGQVKARRVDVLAAITDLQLAQRLTGSPGGGLVTVVWDEDDGLGT